MKKIAKIFAGIVLIPALVVILLFPMMLGKGGGSPSGQSGQGSGTVKVTGDFAFLLDEETDYTVSRGVIPGHVGIDYAVPVGTPVYAISDGVIYMASNQCSPTGGYLGNWCPFDAVAGGGNYVVLRFEHDGLDYFVQFDHLSSASVSPGQEVKKGDKIGISGNSGNTTGPHIHLEAHTGGIYAGSTMNLVDPTFFFTTTKQEGD